MQIAKHVVGPQVKVIATCSAADIEMLKCLGADDFMDHVAQKSYLEKVYCKRKVDAIIDTIGVHAPYVTRPTHLAESKPYLQLDVLSPQ